MRVLLVDPSLFTAPYDAALTEGLVSAGVEPTWAVRPTRRGDRAELAAHHVDAFFYRWSDERPSLPAPLRALLKGLAHAWGLAQLTARVARRRPTLVHFQWTVVPVLDALAIALIRLFCPVIVTVHDTAPYNGDRLPALQRLGFHLPTRLAARVVVHTQLGRERLAQRGVAAAKLAVIPHGPLRLASAPAAPPSRVGQPGCWTFVLFGEIKAYKGLDVLVEALGLLSAELRGRARVIVAGRACMDLAPVLRRVSELGLEPTLELRDRRLTEQEMAELFAEADCFLFPYRQIDASGVYFLVKGLARWIIASRVGVFAEELEEGVHGALVAAADARDLSQALAHALTARPRPQASSEGRDWTQIGRATHALYLEARLEWEGVLAARASGAISAGRPEVAASAGPARAEPD